MTNILAKPKKTIWLSTETNSRAELFYKKQGWKNVGFHGNEIKFEMSFEDWKNLKAPKISVLLLIFYFFGKKTSASIHLALPPPFISMVSRLE